MAARRILSLIAAKLPPNPLRAEISRNSFPLSYPFYARRFQSIPESTTEPVATNQVQHGSNCSNLNPVSETNEASSSNTKHTVFSALNVNNRHDLAMIFTCKVCETRSVKTVCRESYEKGVVIAKCDGCNNNHLIADRLGWFGEPSSVEEFLAARGEEVKKGSLDTINLTLDDLAGKKDLKIDPSL